jgi:hypothetical protein
MPPLWGPLLPLPAESLCEACEEKDELSTKGWRGEVGHLLWKDMFLEELQDEVLVDRVGVAPTVQEVARDKLQSSPNLWTETQTLRDRLVFLL